MLVVSTDEEKLHPDKGVVLRAGDRSWSRWSLIGGGSRHHRCPTTDGARVGSAPGVVLVSVPGTRRA
ncbi:hypothetical protein HMPREF9057_01881 [Actinomyces sp. oral taxon 171 str. F0337]|nr:hypothetical protein HMPREF9057_01881 [Actinomyces sp. oral taxon 171 str. F0337]